MKNLKFKWLLLSFILSIASISQAWAGPTFSGGYVYFHNKGGWNDKFKQLCIGKSDYTSCYDMTAIDNTELWYNALISTGWGDATYMAVVGTNGDAKWGDGSWGTSNLSNATHYTGAASLGSYDFKSGHVSLLSPENGNNGATLSLTWVGDEASDLNTTMTIKAKIWDGDSWEEGTSKGALSATSKTFSNYTTCGTGTSGSVAKNATSGTITVGYTALTTLSVSSVDANYAFMGWYDESGNRLSDNPSFNDYHPASTSNFTVYAYFAPIFTAGSKLYLNTVGDDKWYDGNAVYRAFFFNGGSSAWATCSLTSASHIFECTVPSGTWGAVIFARKDKEHNTENSWDVTWDQTSDMYKKGTHNCVKITGSGNGNQEWHKYAPVPAIVGTMNDWDPVADQLSGSPLKKKISLSGGTAYNFKVANGFDENWYGSGTTDNDLTFVGQTNSETLATGKNNMMLLTAEEGEYTFQWSGSALTITYPTTSHPSQYYAYVTKMGDWNSGNYCYVHYFYGDGGSGKTLTTWGTDNPKIKSYTTINDTAYYYLPILTTYPKFVAKDQIGNETSGKKTGDMDCTDHGGQKVYCPSTTWIWAHFGKFTVTLDEQAGPAVSNNQSVQFNGTALSTSAGAVTPPTYTGYDFGGYWSNEACDDVKVINANGSWVANAAGYTSSSKWIHPGGTATLYAKWSPIKVSSISLDPSSASIYVGSKQTITPTVSPSNALDKAIDWSSSAEGVATVVGGVVTAVAPGTATITATAHDGSGVTQTCSITVGYKVTYNDNGSTSGSVPTDANYYAASADVTVLGNTGTLAKTGYTFAGWNTQSNGLGTDYAASATFDIEANTTLYAKWTNNAYVGKYTFHYGESSDGFDGTWTVAAFTRVGETNEWKIENFTIPDPATAPNFWVGYEGWPKSATLDYLGTSSHSYVTTWSAERTGSTHWGYMEILPGQVKLSDGESKTAQGAVGTLKINTTSTVYNCNPGFRPKGYGLTISNGSTTRIVELKATTNDNVFETDIFDGTELNKLTSAEIAAATGRFKVGLKTASGYVDCYLTAEWDTTSLNANKLEYDTRIEPNKVGRFQVWVNTDYPPINKGIPNYNTPNFSLRYAPMVNKSKSGGINYLWTSDNSWTLGHQPRINEDVILEREKTIDIDTARAKSIKIDNTGKGSNMFRAIQINSGAGLLVAEGITAKHIDDDDFGPTNQWDIYLRNDMWHNAVLICGGASNNTTAMYEFYTKSYKSYDALLDKYWYINQYVGFPFRKMKASKLYGFNIFVYDDSADDWRTPTGEAADSLVGFTAYNLIREYAYTDWNNFDLDGILNLPGLTSPASQHTFTCGTRHNEAGTFDAGEDSGDHLFANSWAAPIEIGAIDATDMPSDKFVQTIYIFNAGHEYDTNGDGIPERVVGDDAGQWSSIPINAAKYTKSHVIPATQAFLVTSKVANATLTLDYKKHVYDPAMDSLTAHKSIDTDPLRAPRRATKESNDPKILKINVLSNDTTVADKLYIFQRQDFSTESYDNGWDGYKLYGESYAAELYTIRGDARMAVDAVKDMDNTSVAFKASKQDSEYTLSFEYNDDEPLYLYDKETNALTQISNDATYEFTTSDTKAHERFLLTRSNSPQIATGVEEVENEAVQHAEKFMQDQQIFIRRGEKVYSVDGTLVK